MIKKGDPAYKHEWRIRLGAPGEVDDAPNYQLEVWSSVQLRVTFGNVYSPGVHGIEVFVQNKSDDPTVPGDSSKCVWHVTTPWGSSSGTITGVVTSDFNLVMDAGALSGGCETWALEFDSLTFGYDSTTLFSLSSTSDSGADYDERLNCNRFDAEVNYNPEVLISYPSCGDSIDDVAAFDETRESDDLVGYRYFDGSVYQYPDINIATAAPISGVCAASECDPPTFKDVSQDDTGGQGCYKCTIPTLVAVLQTKTFIETLHCHCIDPPDRTFTVDVWEVERIFQQQKNSFTMKRKDSPVRNYQVYRNTTCDPLVVEEDTDDVSTTETWCLTGPYDHEEHYVQYCAYGAPAIDCNPSSTPGGPESECDGSLPSPMFYYCKVTAYATMLWPTPVGCTEKNISYDVDYGSVLHIFTSIDDSGKVVVWKAGNPLVWTNYTSAIDATWTCVRIDRDDNKQTIWLAVEDSGSIKLYKSTDRGGTFTLSSTLGTGTKPNIVIGRNGIRFYYWIDGTDIKGKREDRAGNALGSTFTATTGVDDAGFDVDEDITDNGKLRFHMICVKSGTITHLDSSDGITFS